MLSDGGTSQADLRRRALTRLSRPTASGQERSEASTALGVLLKLASSATSAADALAVLHELQVHQVEIELQDEELRRSRAELEATLFRQMQLYDSAPVSCFTVDQNTELLELNLTAAGMLGRERAQLLGRRLDSYLTPHSARALHAMFARVGDSLPTTVGALQLAAGGGGPQSVHASVKRDPGGPHFLLACVDVAEQVEESTR